VTPTSQIVGVQAVLNVLFGRYKQVTKETKDYVRGLYGRPPGKIKEEIKKLILGDEEPINVRPADLLEPMLEKAKKELKEKGYLEKEEDVVTYCLFPQVALEFFELRRQGRLRPVEEKPKGKPIKIYINGKEFEVFVEGIEFEPPKPKPQVQAIPSQPPKREVVAPSGSVVSAPMPGKVLRVLVRVGDRVRVGQGLLVLEAMKMENEIPSPRDGVVKRILVKEGEAVDTGQPLIELG